MELPLLFCVINTEFNLIGWDYTLHLTHHYKTSQQIRRHSLAGNHCGLMAVKLACSMDGGDIIEENGADKQQDTHPWPYLRELFEIVGMKNDSWRMCCKLCQPKYHELLAFKNSPSNLKKHIEVNAYFCCY